MLCIESLQVGEALKAIGIEELALCVALCEGTQRSRELGLLQDSETHRTLYNKPDRLEFGVWTLGFGAVN